METVGVRTLKSQLSQYLQRAKEGTAIIITQRHRPIAWLGPVQSPLFKEVVALVEEGVASWGGGKPRGVPRPIRLKGAKTVSDRVSEDRQCSSMWIPALW
ncbi:type II toxin-antitoxin system Phd/YefM family antitoxin [Candidatus Hakubella thermalkaliphila]|nr:type II toxin-antitoxin system prevent-host-death family antitoxin [Candidatus Hakubella thermalkaliphila]